MSDSEDFADDDVKSEENTEEHEDDNGDELDQDGSTSPHNLLQLLDAIGSTKPNKTVYDRTVNKKRNRDNIICFYCDDFVLRSATTVVPTNPIHRHDCFIFLANGDADVANRMEIQFQKYPSARALCHRHLVANWKLCGKEGQKWLYDEKVLAEWLERLEDERLLRFMTPEYAREKYGATSIANCTRRCAYCRKTSYSSLLFPMDEGHHKRGFSTWINALCLGDERVASLMRADIMHYSGAKSGGGGARLCCAHFLRSQFVGNPLYKTNGVVVAMRLRPGEAPTGDPEVIKSLLEFHSKMKGEKINTDVESSLPATSSADDCKIIEPIPITMNRTMLRGDKVFTYYVEWPYLDSSGKEFVHRFACKTKISERFYCIACKACFKEIHETYTKNVAEYQKKFPKCKGNSKNAYALWLSDKKTWLKTQFTYKVFEFSAKAKLIWDKTDEAERQEYYRRAEEMRWKKDLEFVENMKLADKEHGLRPPGHGLEPVFITIVNRMMLTDPDDLEHLCMTVSRPFIEDHMVDNKYEPPLLPFRRFPDPPPANEIKPIVNWTPDPVRAAKYIQEAGPKGNINALVSRPDRRSRSNKPPPTEEELAAKKAKLEQQEKKPMTPQQRYRRKKKNENKIMEHLQKQIDVEALNVLQEQFAAAVEAANKELKEQQEHADTVAGVMALLNKET